ncbi:unnamed protein product, partial [Prorocentrum cordatum]
GSSSTVVGKLKTKAEQPVDECEPEEIVEAPAGEPEEIVEAPAEDEFEEIVEAPAEGEVEEIVEAPAEGEVEEIVEPPAADEGEDAAAVEGEQPTSAEFEVPSDDQLSWEKITVKIKRRDSEQLATIAYKYQASKAKWLQLVQVSDHSTSHLQQRLVGWAPSEISDLIIEKIFGKVAEAKTIDKLA